MCGIAGTIDTMAERAAARVSLLNDAQTHRGPDHSVIVRVGGITLGNTRLAIQDPTPAGNQPFVSADGRYTCVFNGEIYNHRQLAERFRLPVRTACDGEVIPQLWAKLGMESLAELRGMFAIALVDTLEERLYLARDPFGIKPLYWRLLPDGSLVFASEVRPLARLAPGTRVDDAAVARYLRFGAMAADQSPFREITAVPPNSVAVVRQDRRVEVRAVRPDGPVAVQQQPSDLGAALAESIDLHLGADVPTALLLSGGVDSAAIAAISRRLGRDLHCLTVAADGAPDETLEASSDRAALRASLPAGADRPGRQRRGKVFPGDAASECGWPQYLPHLQGRPRGRLQGGAVRARRRRSGRRVLPFPAAEISAHAAGLGCCSPPGRRHGRQARRHAGGGGGGESQAAAG